MLIVLDRDGVINEESSEYIKSPEEWVPIQGSLEAIVKLKNAGFQVVVATNQSGVGRGFYTEETLLKIHTKMSQALNEQGAILDGIFYCPHHPNDNCACRKPKPGLFKMIQERFGVSSHNMICIGDSLRDIQAAKMIGAKPILVLTGNGRDTVRKLNDSSIPIYTDLAEVVKVLLNQ